MTTTGTDARTEHAAWKAAREETLREPHGWLSLTALHWLDDGPGTVPGLPGTWRATGGGTVTVTAAAADGVVPPGADTPLDGTVDLHPVDGAPGVMVAVGDRMVEIARRTDSSALRIRDPHAVTRTTFTGVPAYPYDEAAVVDAAFTPYDEPRRITVDAVVDGLQHFPTAVGEVTFRHGGAQQRLVALSGRDGGLSLHFRDATSGDTTYGGGRILKTADPGADGALRLDLNRVVNLPCAFTAHATCPLPPAGNHLDVAVEAGETLPPRPDLA
ncbi:hypothetical protein Ae168Ps1_5886c [Pseudonocardia sp. Ae168_Ps1]|uniref:DUF1684 domain-containing protein n=1 Tax=unclassified Pseudonocardia TaxID=2619320 RepID=UPI00094B67E1|nr:MULTISPECIES: DUF1684 domain-containing protein [unclassified Pseudonocardia]OLL71383.1 hypothetical protein Ae168Ps1_5886c [Pseudonocardia sp. Ae168_Ps1]OLL77070.1 hypothetical protein Ae150APs1_5448 [Pseudonocardia sp. Ae150A_Ps1]OLL88819.1 hypothetical protein Ae263Ps1_5874c [Pseudonocardia sp. Ae263_Ps1]OLL91155.1 hypothetical protein Ae356Ps1_1052 [Pseudonocardia sp. Ae356_Ps1]